MAVRAHRGPPSGKRTVHDDQGVLVTHGRVLKTGLYRGAFDPKAGGWSLTISKGDDVIFEAISYTKNEGKVVWRAVKNSTARKAGANSYIHAKSLVSTMLKEHGAGITIKGKSITLSVLVDALADDLARDNYDRGSMEYWRNISSALSSETKRDTFYKTHRFARLPNRPTVVSFVTSAIKSGAMVRSKSNDPSAIIAKRASKLMGSPMAKYFIGGDSANKVAAMRAKRAGEQGFVSQETGKANTDDKNARKYENKAQRARDDAAVDSGSDRQDDLARARTDSKKARQARAKEEKAEVKSEEFELPARSGRAGSASSNGSPKRSSSRGSGRLITSDED